MKTSEDTHLSVYNDYGYCNYGFQDNGKAIIYNLHVFEEHRRKGKARELLGHAIFILHKIMPGVIIDIEAQPKRDSIDKEKLISFYKSMGLNVLK